MALLVKSYHDPSTAGCRTMNGVQLFWLARFYLRSFTFFERNIFRIEKAQRRKLFDEIGTVQLLAAHGTRGHVQLGQAWQLRDFLSTKITTDCKRIIRTVQS
eukprot:COSAG03_NODE_292_length_9302_cov_9.489188_4_plen_102_part_00